MNVNVIILAGVIRDLQRRLLAVVMGWTGGHAVVAVPPTTEGRDYFAGAHEALT